MSATMAIAAKDLRSAFRNRNQIVALVMLVLMIVIAFSFAVRLVPAGEYQPADPTSAATRGALLASATPGLLWILLLASALLVLPRAVTAEVDRGTIDGLLLAPVDEGHIFAGKFLANFALLSVAVIESVFLFIVFLGVDMGARTGYVVLLLLLGAVGLAATGTLLAAATARSRARELLFVVVLVPIALWSLVLPGIEATTGVLASEGAPNPFRQMLLLALADGLYLGLGWALMEYTVRDG